MGVVGRSSGCGVMGTALALALALALAVMTSSEAASAGSARRHRRLGLRRMTVEARSRRVVALNSDREEAGGGRASGGAGGVDGE